MSEQTTLLGRTLGIFRGIAASAGFATPEPATDELGDADRAALRARMAECLEARGGEVLARARAATIGETYLSLGELGKKRFFQLMAHEFGCDPKRIDEAARRYLAGQDGDEAAQLQAREGLRASLSAPWVQLLTQFNSLPGGMKFLADMRSDLQGFMRTDPYLADLDIGFRRLLTTWFDVGFLKLERITWDSPAALLEKLIAYEAVHEFAGWQDLRHRLHGNRRLYAFFHPSMPGEPLIFVQVALVDGIAGNVQYLLDPRVEHPEPSKADTAIFYSITNTQSGLRGISFGNFLIKQVVDDLARDLPHLKQFATLSPLPGFRAWLERRIGDSAEMLLNDKERAKIEEVAGVSLKTITAAVLAQPDWLENEDLREVLAPVLKRAAALYLISRDDRERPLDAVARFHLGNGARIERLHVGADSSGAGLAKSFTVMVNYLYPPDEIERNHEAFAESGVITIAPEIAELLKGRLDGKDTSVRVARRSGAIGRMMGRT